MKKWGAGQNAYRESAQHNKYDAAENKCRSSATPSEAVDCLNKAEKAERERDNSEQDLNAQRQMTDWAWWMMWASIATTFVTALGAILIAITLAATRETVAVVRNEQRPWLEIRDTSLSHAQYGGMRRDGVGPEQFGCGIDWTIRNFGKSPAYFCYSELVVTKLNTDEGAQKIAELDATSREFEVSGVYIPPGGSTKRWGMGFVVPDMPAPRSIPTFFQILVGYSSGPDGPRFVTMVSGQVSNRGEVDWAEPSEILNVEKLNSGEHVPTIGQVMCFRMD